MFYLAPRLRYWCWFVVGNVFTLLPLIFVVSYDAFAFVAYSGLFLMALVCVLVSAAAHAQRQKISRLYASGYAGEVTLPPVRRQRLLGLIAATLFVGVLVLSGLAYTVSGSSSEPPIPRAAATDSNAHAGASESNPTVHCTSDTYAYECALKQIDLRKKSSDLKDAKTALCRAAMLVSIMLLAYLLVLRKKAFPLPNLASEYANAPDVARRMARQATKKLPEPEPTVDWRIYHDIGKLLLIAGLDEAFFRKTTVRKALSASKPGSQPWYPNYASLWLGYFGPALSPLALLLFLPIFVNDITVPKFAISLCVVMWAIWAVAAVAYFVESDFVFAEFVRQDQASSLAAVFFAEDWQSGRSIVEKALSESRKSFETIALIMVPAYMTYVGLLR